MDSLSGSMRLELDFSFLDSGMDSDSSVIMDFEQGEAVPPIRSDIDPIWISPRLMSPAIGENYVAQHGNPVLGDLIRDEATAKAVIEFLKTVLTGHLCTTMTPTEFDVCARILPPLRAFNNLLVHSVGISVYFLRYLPALLTPENRMGALKALQITCYLLKQAVEAKQLSGVDERQRDLVEKVYHRCENFYKAFGWALDNLYDRIRNHDAEFNILLAVKVLVKLVLSLRYRELRGFREGILEEILAAETLRETSNRRIQLPPPFRLDSVIPDIPRVAAQSVGLFQPLEIADILNLLPLDATPEQPIQLPQETSPESPRPNESASNHDEIFVKGELTFSGGRVPINGGHLVMMFRSHEIPTTPFVAGYNSKYVRVAPGQGLMLLNSAYLQENAEGCAIPAFFVVNEIYEAPNLGNTDEPKRCLAYLGFAYPDQTSLSYIPLQFARLLYDERPQVIQGTHATFAILRMDLQRGLYRNIKAIAYEVFLGAHPGSEIADQFEQTLIDGEMIRIEVLTKLDRIVKVCDGNRCLNYPVLQALLRCGHDICGKTLLHLRFSNSVKEPEKMRLQFILFGMTVKRTAGNHFTPIFGLVNP